jgi:hypothetical protein
MRAVVLADAAGDDLLLRGELRACPREMDLAAESR